MILYIALFVLIPIAALTFGLLRIGLSFNDEALSAVQDEQALFVAESGLVEAIQALKNDGTGNVASAAAPAYFGRGAFWVERTDIGNKLLLLHSSGVYRGGRASIQSLVFYYVDSLLGTTIFSNRCLTIESNAFFDSFDSSLGTYASQVIGGAAQDGVIIESNECIEVRSAVEINGDVHPGPGYDVDYPNSASISGALQSLEEPRTIDPVVVPVIPSSGPLTVGGNLTLAAGDHHFDSVTNQVGSVLTIEGPARVVVGDWLLDSNTELILDTVGGPIELFVKGDFDQASNSMITTTVPAAANVRLNLVGGTDQVVDFRSNSEFYGVIYAPLATVNLHSNFEVFGTVIAEDITINSNVKIHYDESLIDSLGLPYSVDVATWNTTGFPIQALSRNRMDPFRVLGLDPEALPLPGDAREPK